MASMGTNVMMIVDKAKAIFVGNNRGVLHSQFNVLHYGFHTRKEKMVSAGFPNINSNEYSKEDNGSGFIFVDQKKRRLDDNVIDQVVLGNRLEQEEDTSPFPKTVALGFLNGH